MDSLVLLGFASLLCAAVAITCAYQAVTGRRLGKVPGQADARTVRRDSSIAAIALAFIAVIGFATLTYDYWDYCCLLTASS